MKEWDAMNTPTLEARIDLSAVSHNIGVLRTHTSAQVLAVVKADGYGHGAVEVGRADRKSVV